MSHEILDGQSLCLKALLIFEERMSQSSGKGGSVVVLSQYLNYGIKYLFHLTFSFVSQLKSTERPQRSKTQFSSIGQC